MSRPRPSLATALCCVAIVSCAVQTSDGLGTRAGGGSSSTAGSDGLGGSGSGSGGSANTGGASAGGSIATGGASSGGFTSTGGSGTGGVSTTGGSSSTGGATTGGSGNGSGGATSVPCECASLTGTASATCSTPSKKGFETGTEGAYTLFKGIDGSSLQSCGDQVYCGSAALLACANFNTSVTPPPYDTSTVTTVSDIVVSVTPPADGWIGKTASASVYFDGPSFLENMRIELRIGSEVVINKDLIGASDANRWHTLSKTIGVEEGVSDSANQISILFRQGGEWQGRVFVDHIVWE